MKCLSMKDHRGVRQYYRAETFEGLVQEMYKDAYLPTDSIEEYVEGIAQRGKIWDGSVTARIRLSTS